MNKKEKKLCKCCFINKTTQAFCSGCREEGVTSFSHDVNYTTGEILRPKLTDKGTVVFIGTQKDD